MGEGNYELLASTTICRSDCPIIMLSQKRPVKIQNFEIKKSTTRGYVGSDAKIRYSRD